VVDFTIPTGQVWVVTSIDWEVQGVLPSQLQTAFFFVATTVGDNGPAGQSTVLADGKGRVGASAVFPTGIVVKAGQSLCIAMPEPEGDKFFSGVAHGFFAPDK